MCGGMENKSMKLLKVTITALLFATLVGAETASETSEGQRTVFRPYETTECEQRQTPGLICPSCSVVGTCVRINSQWSTVYVAECDNSAGMFCNVREGGCSSLPGPCNKIGHSQNFVCTSVGIFPDPYDCQKYHFCQQSGNSFGAINLDCGGQSAYNPTTGQCSMTLTDDVCRFNQYVCDHVGQKAVWPGNDNIFYICKETVSGNATHLYPTMYRCSAEEIFNGTECVPAPNGNSNITTLTPPTATPDDCPSFGLFPFPGDCSSYIFCDNDLMPTVYKCPAGTLFDSSLQGCVRGECVNELKK